MFKKKNLLVFVAIICSLLFVILLMPEQKSPNRLLLEESFKELNLQKPQKTGVLDGCSDDLYGENSCFYTLSYYYEDASYRETINQSLNRNKWQLDPPKNYASDSNRSDGPHNWAHYFKIVNGQKICASTYTSDFFNTGSYNNTTFGLSTDEKDCK